MSPRRASAPQPWEAGDTAPAAGECKGIVQSGLVAILILLLSAALAHAESGRNAETVLAAWIGRMEVAVHATERDELARRVAETPLPEAIDGPGFAWRESSGGWLAEPLARDWAFAAEGFGYTLRGIFVTGEATQLDVGLWCFLQAARLRPDEPEHLVNVAFHLNERAAHADARVLLEHALRLDPELPGAHNNLAFAHAGEGALDAAIAHAMQAFAAPEGSEIVAERLSSLLNRAGQPEAGAAARAVLVGAPVAFPDVRPTTPEGRAVKQRLLELNGRMNDAYFAGIADMRTSPSDVLWAPNWSMSQDEHAYYEGSCLPDGFCSRLGGINIGHYLSTDTFRYFCRARQPECAEPGATVDCVVAECTFCVIVPAFELAGIYALSHARSVAARQHELALVQRIVSAHRARGISLIEAADLDPDDHSLLLDYWHTILIGRVNGALLELNSEEGAPYVTISQIAAGSGAIRDCISGAAEAEARLVQEQARHDRFLDGQPFAVCPSPVCANFTIPIGLLTLEFNPRTRRLESVELGLGDRLGVSLGWNLRRSEPSIGFGVGFGLAGYSAASASVRFSPSGGIEGTVEFGANLPGPTNSPLMPLKSSRRMFQFLN